MTDEALNRYQNPDDDPRGLWKSDPAHAQAGHATESQFYVLTAPNGRKHSLPQGRCWLYTEPVMKEAIADGRIWFGKDGNNVPRIKTYLTAKERGLTPETLWFADDVSTNELAKNELKEIFVDNPPFTTPKPHQLVERILQIASDSDSIILDSFAGSGTTAHAVLNMNKADGGNRKFILVEMMDYADSITSERIKRVINGYADVEGTGGTFSFYDLGEPLMIEDKINENIEIEKIREYIWYTETKTPVPLVKGSDNAHFLGKCNGTAYYFYYEKDGVTTLDFDYLASISEKEGHYMIYADKCALSPEELLKYNITFKKIPRDIVKL